MRNSKFSSRSVAIGVDALNDMNISGPVTITVEGGFEYPSGQGNTAVGDGAMRMLLVEAITLLLEKAQFS